MSDPGPRHQQKNPYQQSADEVVSTLASDSRNGLSESEARERLDKYGANELKAKKPVPGWKKLLAQFQNVLVVLLLAATAISAGLWWYERDAALPYEAIAIFAIVLLNALDGLYPGIESRGSGGGIAADVRGPGNVVRGGERRPCPQLDSCPATSSSSRKATPFQRTRG